MLDLLIEMSYMERGPELDKKIDIFKKELDERYPDDSLTDFVVQRFKVMVLIWIDRCCSLNMYSKDTVYTIINTYVLKWFRRLEAGKFI